MLRHILLFKFNEGVDQGTRVDAVDRLKGLGDQCPSVIDWYVAVNMATSRSAYDVAEIATFADEAALDDYKAHPAHRELSAHLGTISTWALVDSELPL